jgi:Right handed beta helix region
MYKAVFFGVLWALLTVQLAAAGNTYYVATNGNNGNGCNTNINTPQRDIKNGIACLGPGDTLRIRGGTYAEPLDTCCGTVWPSGTSWSNAITIEGYPGETVIIQPNIGQIGYLVSMFKASGITQYIILNNLSFVETRTNVNAIIRPDKGAQFIRISNCKIHGNIDDHEEGAGMGILAGKGIEILNNELWDMSSYAIYMPEDNNLVDGNYIHNVGGYGIHQYGTGCSTCSNNIIRNNRLIGNGRLIGTAGQPGCGMVLSSGVNNVAYNNVVAGHQNGGCAIQVYGGMLDAQVYNNTIVGNSGPCVKIDPGAQNAIVRNNICYNNGSDIANAGINSTIDHNTTNAVDPHLANDGAGYYHLTASSACCIDTGFTIALVPDDIDHDARLSGSYDIGADEFGGGAQALPAPANLRVIGTTSP